jgi:hypothetical protein
MGHSSWWMKLQRLSGGSTRAESTFLRRDRAGNGDDLKRATSTSHNREALVARQDLLHCVTATLEASGHRALVRAALTLLCRLR